MGKFFFLGTAFSSHGTLLAYNNEPCHENFLGHFIIFIKFVSFTKHEDVPAHKSKFEPRTKV